MKDYHKYIILLAALLVQLSTVASAETIATEKHRLGYETVVEGLSNPWSLAFLPGGGMLISERSGTLRIVNTLGKLE
ncbi:MAG: PQQ-dependent sugar dehydrogenase, partial [Candidatus Thiodiazotropha sp.]